MTTIAVTGAGGYIGSCLVEMLLERGFDVLAIDRYYFGENVLPVKPKGGKLRVLKKDIRLISHQDLSGVTTVMDLAGLSNDPTCDLNPNFTQEINFGGCKNVFLAAQKAGVKRFIYSSSCSVYGEGSGDVLTEESALKPVSAYAAAKIQAEEFLFKTPSDMTVTLLRNATVYGLSRRMRFDLIINIMTMYAFRDSKIFILSGGRQWRPIVHVNDVSAAFIRVHEAQSSKVHKKTFNVGSNEQNYQVFQVANIVKSVFPTTELIQVPSDQDKRSYHVNFDKIKNELDFYPTKTPLDGVLEIKKALEEGIVDPNDLKTSTLKYYQYLLSAEQVIRDLAIGGKIFDL